MSGMPDAAKRDLWNWGKNLGIGLALCGAAAALVLYMDWANITSGNAWLTIVLAGLAGSLIAVASGVILIASCIWHRQFLLATSILAGSVLAAIVFLTVVMPAIQAAREGWRKNDVRNRLKSLGPLVPVQETSEGPAISSRKQQ